MARKRNAKGQFTSGGSGSVDIQIFIDSEGAEEGLGDLNASFAGAFGGIKDAVGTANQGLELVGKAIEFVGNAIAATAGKALEFRTGITEIRTLVDDSFISHKALGEEIERLAIKFGALPTETTAAYYDGVSAGASTAAEATILLEQASKLATIGQTEQQVAIDGVTTILNAYNLSFGEAERVSDALFTAVQKGKTKVEALSNSLGRIASTAASANIEIEELFAAIATMTAGGLRTSEAVTGLNSALANVKKPTSDAEKEAKRLGVAFNSTALRAKGLNKFLLEIQQSSRFNTTTFEKLFGSIEAGNAIIALTVDGSKKFSNNLDTMAKSAGVVGEQFDIVSQEIEFQVKQFNTLREVALISLGKLTTESENAKRGIQGINAVLEETIRFLKSKEGAEAIEDFFGKMIVAVEITLATFKTMVGVLEFVVGGKALKELEKQLTKSINLLDNYRRGVVRGNDDFIETLATAQAELTREIAGTARILAEEEGVSQTERLDLSVELDAMKKQFSDNEKMFVEAEIDGRFKQGESLQTLRDRTLAIYKELIGAEDKLAKKRTKTPGPGGGGLDDSTQKELDATFKRGLANAKKNAEKLAENESDIREAARAADAEAGRLSAEQQRARDSARVAGSNKTTKALVASQKKMNTDLASVGISGIVAFSNAIGSSFESGRFQAEKALAAFGSVILSGLGTQLIVMGSAAVAAGLLGTVSPIFTAVTGGPAAVAAGTGLILAGGALHGLGGLIGSLGSGGGGGAAAGAGSSGGGSFGGLPAVGGGGGGDSPTFFATPTQGGGPVTINNTINLLGQNIIGTPATIGREVRQAQRAEGRLTSASIELGGRF